jgi:hypothetical protein
VVDPMGKDRRFFSRLHRAAPQRQAAVASRHPGTRNSSTDGFAILQRESLGLTVRLPKPSPAGEPPCQEPDVKKATAPDNKSQDIEIGHWRPTATGDERV